MYVCMYLYGNGTSDFDVGCCDSLLAYLDADRGAHCGILGGADDEGAVAGTDIEDHILRGQLQQI